MKSHIKKISSIVLLSLIFILNSCDKEDNCFLLHYTQKSDKSKNRKSER
jgi:hypothetical protein